MTSAITMGTHEVGPTPYGAMCVQHLEEYGAAELQVHHFDGVVSGGGAHSDMRLSQRAAQQEQPHNPAPLV